MDDDPFDVLVKNLRELQCCILQSHETTVDAVAAAQTSDRSQLTLGEIAKLLRLTVATTKANIGALMAIGHVLDIMIDHFEEIRTDATGHE